MAAGFLSPFPRVIQSPNKVAAIEDSGPAGRNLSEKSLAGFTLSDARHGGLGMTSEGLAITPGDRGMNSPARREYREKGSK